MHTRTRTRAATITGVLAVLLAVAGGGGGGGFDESAGGGADQKKGKAALEVLIASSGDPETAFVTDTAEA